MHFKQFVSFNIVEVKQEIVQMRHLEMLMAGLQF